MSTASYSASSTMSVALQGLREAAGGLRSAAETVSQATTVALNGEGGEVEGVVDARRPSLEAGLIDSKQATYAFLASARIVGASDQQWRSMLDLVLPEKARDGA